MGKLCLGSLKKVESAHNPSQNLHEEIQPWLPNAYSESQLGLKCPFWARISLFKKSNGKCQKYTPAHLSRMVRAGVLLITAFFSTGTYQFRL